MFSALRLYAGARSGAGLLRGPRIGPLASRPGGLPRAGSCPWGHASADRRSFYFLRAGSGLRCASVGTVSPAAPRTPPWQAPRTSGALLAHSLPAIARMLSTTAHRGKSGVQRGFGAHFREQARRGSAPSSRHTPGRAADAARGKDGVQRSSSGAQGPGGAGTAASGPSVAEAEAAEAAAAASGFGGRVAQSTRDLELVLMRAIHVQSTETFRMLALVLAALGVLAWVFQDPIVSTLGRRGGDVAAKSLAHEEVQLRAEQVAKAVVHTVLNDPEVLDLATLFLRNILVQEESRAEVARLLRLVLQDPTVKAEIRRLGIWLVQELSNDPYTQANVAR